jgi:predicted O-linked N-acetylglucosamine transferase (SPINDLY family)
VDIHFNRGIALADLRQHEAALASYDCALALKPNHAGAHNNRGIALKALRQFDAAIASYDRALSIDPNHADAYFNRGDACFDLKQYETALTAYDKALSLDPEYEFLRGASLYLKMQMCDWVNFDEELAQLINKIKRAEKAAPPFPVLAFSNSLSVQRIAAEVWLKESTPGDMLPKLSKYPRHHKIRIGYFSADFREHPVSRLTAELYEIHDRSRFEIIAFSFGQDTQDNFRKRLEGSFDKFIDVRNKSDREIATLSRKMEIDIAVDLGGLTKDSRTGIFAMRAAPIQVSYIGYLGTMGVDYMDYLIADKTIIPDQHLDHYSERIVYLPSYQVNDSKRCIPDITFSRQQLGLPETGFVFCCFNNTYKITPATFDGWMRILKKVEGSVLFLYANNERSKSNLRKEAALREVDPERLVFGKPLAEAEYLARYRTADLFLDTLPYNAGTTASDALWVGLPVLSCAGETFASRVGASLLNAVHLPELITSTQEQYEKSAIELATHPKKLSAIRQKLMDTLYATPLFNTDLFTKHLETAYIKIYERYQADLACEHIYIRADD